MDVFLKNLEPFDSLGDFMSVLFFNRIHGESDPRGLTHAKVVARFLQGKNTTKMADVLPLMYKHRNSYPSINSRRAHEQDDMFSDAKHPKDIHHARPCMSTWALGLIASEARRSVGEGTRDDPDDPDDHVQLRAKTNGRGKGEVITRQHIGNFSMSSIEAKYKKRHRVPMFLIQHMCAPRVKGVFIVRQRRPYPMIQVTALASFIVSRNRYACGDLAMILGVWHFAVKSHVDVKRVYCRLGSSVSDTTARDALSSITIAGFIKLRAEVQDALERGQTEHCTILDNIQEYCDVYEQGIGRQSQLKVGTAGTNVKLQDCEPGALDAAGYNARVASGRRRELTVESLFHDIDWVHIDGVTNLHWVRKLAEFAPQLEPLRCAIHNLFRNKYAKHRMRAGRPPTKFQPYKANSERETETQGTERADRDFDVQQGIDPDGDSGLLSWVCGDGSSYASILRLSRYNAPLGKFKNKISTPEIWHTGATDLNSVAANHYGLATSSDPSSLSKCSNAAGFKRPSNIKSCDYYPTMRNLRLIWTAHILGCWRLFFGVDNLLQYLDDLATSNRLPTLEALLENASLLTDRYVSQAATEHALDTREATSNEYDNQVPEGSPWVPKRSVAQPDPTTDDEDTMPGLVEIEDPAPPVDAPEEEKEKDEGPKHHQEIPGFTGDRVLRNSEIFMMEFGWWVEMALAVAEGDIGRVWEILKIWIFKFAGSSHQNYMAYLLEVYCFLRYEASKDLNNAVLNNWLVNVEGELGKWLLGDLHQEHYNRWLEDMVQKHGGEFDNKFFREIISPNVHHFLRIKEEITTAFTLKRRGRTHTSPHLRDELHLLLTMFKEQEVHLFRSGRSMGHAAVKQFARGCRRLEAGKLDEWLKKSCLGDILEEINRPPKSPSPSHSPPRSSSSSMRSIPPAASEENSDCRSVDSANSSHSIISILSSADSNEPDDDGEDRTGYKLSSGSYNAAYIDPDTGLMEHDEDVEIDLEELFGGANLEGTEEQIEEEEEPDEEEEGTVYAHSEDEVDSE
ncbi:hypothetical protein DFH07DRAFT_865690 [Mycena maculata]|uniref:DUF6589 domain-containing protein n=1 Tax=Mycena maculata TaxID=230809 RepID=A0AAD7NVK6_9AGAR|nr:hypothetical protein DFH07DRAFT_865690 [Mycena maculata]